MDDIKVLLEISSRDHSHICPRQVLGVRTGLLGMRMVGFDERPSKKQLLVIAETDGCFVDGISAATGCMVGHRTLRIEDYGKTGAVFANVETGISVRVSPALDIREKAYDYAPEEARHYFAQLQSYQIMPDDIMFTVVPVTLNTPVSAIISRPGVRVNCDNCGEEILNEREIKIGDLVLCRACAKGAYYTTYNKVEYRFSAPAMTSVH